MKNSFTMPKLAKFPIESGKQWYVWFRFNGGNPIRIYKGVNDYPDYETREQEGLILCDAVHLKLKQGWVPDNSKNIVRSKRIIPAFEDAIESLKPKVSTRTYKAYSGTTNFFIDALKHLKFDRMLSENFTRIHAKKCLEFIREERQWTNHAYNKNLGYIRSVFHEIIEAEHAQLNPFRDIKNLKETKTEANIPPTDEEMKLICDELQAKNYGFYVFYMVIYFCGIRPDELRQLRIRHIDFGEKMFILPPEITKTNKTRYVPMLGNTFELLKTCTDFPPDYFIFGTWVPNGGRHSQRNWFAPNPYQIKDDTPNRQWKKLIKDGLGIQKSLYSAKHKGADDKLDAGMDLQTICDIFGHSETKMTERYARKVKLDRFESARNIKLKSF